MPATTPLREHSFDQKQTFEISWPDDTRILLVEDNRINRQIATIMLTKLKCQVDVAENGIEAIEALKKSSYALVIMDMQMPLMGGIEATNEIRKQETGTLYPDIPIIAVTANATQEEMHKCRNAGMNDFIQKPFTIQILKDILKKWMPGEEL